MSTTITYIENRYDTKDPLYSGDGVELSIKEIRERLGSKATDEDAQRFAEKWNKHFGDKADPTFDNPQEVDEAWAEVLKLAEWETSCPTKP